LKRKVRAAKGTMLPSGKGRAIVTASAAESIPPLWR